MSKKALHLLVIRTSAMGDVAMMVPILVAFSKQYPNSKVTVLTKTFFAPMFAQIPNLEVKSFDTKGIHKGILGIQKLAKEIKALQVDVIIDLHEVLRTNILKNILRFSGIPFLQIDKGRNQKKALTRRSNKIFKPLKHTIDRYAEVFENINFSIDLKTEIHTLKKISISKETQSLVGVSAQKWIGIAPFATHEGKVYPALKLEKIIKALNDSGKYKLILFGSKEESLKLKAIEDTYAQVVSIAGKISFEEELHLISNLDIMVAMDSGNGHLAAMYGIPVITIWGVTHPYAGFTPYNQPTEHQIVPDLIDYPLIPTSIYGNKVPEGYENVMNSIRPQTILDKIVSVVG